MNYFVNKRKIMNLWNLCANGPLLGTLQQFVWLKSNTHTHIYVGIFSFNLRQKNISFINNNLRIFVVSELIRIVVT